MESLMYEMEELIPIVAQLSEQYTSCESTSITYEKANQLMEAVIYCIHECQTSGAEGLAPRRADGKTSAKEAYQFGRRLVEDKVRAMKELYHDLIRDFRHYGNIALKDTVESVPEFLKWYDVRYAPQETILTLDYPLLTDLNHCMQRDSGGSKKWRHTGIDIVYEYVKCICIEQRFLNQFPENYVTQVLRNSVENLCFDEGGAVSSLVRYEEIVENICGILLADVVWHLVLKKQFDGNGITVNDRGRIQAVFGMHSMEESKETARRMVKEFVWKFYGNDDEMWRYLRQECDNIVVRMLHTVV